MESGSASKKEGVLLGLSRTSEAFVRDVLAPLRSCYLCEESRLSFRYPSALLIQNEQLEKKYNAFRSKKRELGYTEKDLKESYGFLLFSDINKAEKLGETGVLAGNSTCKTLGDPTKGVYISQYSDRLDQNSWSYGKSGYIVVLKVTKGRVKEVSEKYTQNVTAPTGGFDCHISKEFSTVISNTSSFLAFQRTQCYLYEFLGDGSEKTVQSPSAARLYAIVPFSYVDPKAKPVTLPYRSEQRELAWRGQLYISSQCYSAGLRAAVGALIPAGLPSVLKVDRVISLSDLRKALPKAIFQTCFSGEVFVGGLYYSLCELVSFELDQSDTLSLLLQEIKTKDIALTVPLNDRGFVILLPSSYFPIKDSGSGAKEFLQGIFVFPDPRLIHTDVFPSKVLHRSPTTSPEILSEVLEQQMQSYTSLINHGTAASPSKENAVISDRYQVPETDSRHESFPEWTNTVWQKFSSYLRNLDSFQLPVSKTSDVLSPGKEKGVEDVVDSINLCMLSSEEVPASHAGLGSVGRLTSPDAVVNKTSVDRSAEGHPDLKTLSQSVKLGDLLIETGDTETKNSPSSGDLRAELIVSITSAEPTVSGSGDGESKSTFNAAPLPGFQTDVSGGEEKDTDKKVLESPKKVHKGNRKGPKHPPRARDDMDGVLKEEQIMRSQHKRKGDEVQHNSRLHVGVDSGKTQTHRFGKLLKNKQMKSAVVGLTIAEAKKPDHENVEMELGDYSLRRKMEHWGLKPVISKCGRILVPHGSVYIFEQIKDLKNAEQSGIETNCEKMAMNVHDTSKLLQDPKREKAVVSSPKGEENRHEVLPENSVLQQPDNERTFLPLVQQSRDNERTDSLPWLERLSPEKPGRRMETLINKLKSVLRGKRKPDLWTEGADNPENADLCLKRGKFETQLGFLKKESSEDAKEGVSTLLSVDPNFAFALGLTPASIPNKMLKLEDACVQQRKGRAESKGATPSDGQPQIIQSPLPIFPQRRRIKMLRKHQGASTENVKEKWWLYCQPPACLNREDVEDKEDHPEGKAAEQRSSCSPTDGLNLLADLALCATSDELPSQPEQAHESLKTSCCKNADGVIEQESVLHSLLRQPAARPPHSLQSPPPHHHVGDGELAGLITKEHAYSMHPSTSLLLGFSSMPFQVYPLSGCTRLLYRHQTQDLTVDQEDKSNPETPECLENPTSDSRRFKRSRTFVIKDGSVQVTKRWKRNYDFGLDSKFSNDPQFRTICRALHGPWDFSVKDTSDDVRLIFHMWIALFYSRSMPRTFDLDSEPSGMETLIGSVSAAPHSDLIDSSFALDPNVKDTSDASMSTSLDLTTSETPVWGQRCVVLDLSKKNFGPDIATSVSQVIPMKNLETLTAPMMLHTITPFQCCRSFHPTEQITKAIDIGDAHDCRTHSILQEYAPFHPGTATWRSDSVFREPNNENTDTHLLSDKDRDWSGGVHTRSGGKKQSQDVSMELPTQVQEGIGAVNKGDHLGKEKQPCVLEPEVLSQIKVEDADEAIECWPTQDSVSKDLYPKREISSSILEADLSDQQSAMGSDSLDSVEKDSAIDEKHQPQQDICCTDEQDQWLQRDDLDRRNELEGKGDASQQRVDEPHYEKAALIVSDETIGSLDQSIPPTNGEETQERRVEASLIRSLECDQKGEGSELIDSRIPEEGVHEDANHPHDTHSDGVADEAEGQKEKPFIDGTAASRPTDVQEASCAQRGQAELSKDRTPPSLHDDRCPTPTLDEEPYRYAPSSGPSGEGTKPPAIPVDETPKPMSQKGQSRISASLKGKTPLQRKQKAAVKGRRNTPSAPTAVNCKEKHFSAQNHKAKEKHNTARGKPPASSAEKTRLPAQSVHLPEEPLQNLETNTKKDEAQTPQQVSVEPPSCSHSPVIPAQMPKSFETQGQITSEDLKIENSKVEPSKTSTDLKTPRLLEERTKNVEDQCERREEEEGTSELRPQSSSNVNKSDVEKPTHQAAALFPQLKRGISPEFKRIVEIVGKESPERCGTEQEHTDDAVGDDLLRQGSRGSLRCTIFNTSRKTSSSFLEKMSRRCLQEDLTEALVETECLIFSEQMKQVLKKSKDDSNRNRAPDPFRSSPATAKSGRLPDKGEAEAGLGSSPFVGLKITVDVSDRKPKDDTTQEETSGSSKRDGESRLKAGRARPHAGKTDGLRKGPVRHKDVRLESGERKADPSDLCDHVKRESSHKNLHLVVKRSGKAKSRFYILVTSDDPLFEETKVRLEAEGHTAVQPSEFFLAEESSSNLLIILRNEDIAKHICEVPYLLSLKKLPGVQFAGIDEPDDVLNLTHQELFVRGGFIMFDRAALESLRLRDMKLLSDILQELSRSGRWRWILHYRHSRWLKEKSRRSGEAREKRNFISWCQEAGLLEVLPYHQCDHLSRDQPDYLTCLVRLQVQNVSARYPVFITEMTTNSSFGTHGILTLTLRSFLTCKSFLV